MADALRRQRLAAADERAKALLDWLNGGGSLPQTGTLMSRDEIKRECRRVIAKNE
jgi:hypothetical protein